MTRENRWIIKNFSKLIDRYGGEFTATIGFSEHLKIGFNLLGREDIFKVFRVCFSDKYHEVTFTVTV